MRHARLAAFFAALVLILSLAVPALASEEPAEEETTASVSYLVDDAPCGWIRRIGEKIFYIDYQYQGDNERYYLTVMEPALGGYRTTQLFEMPRIGMAVFRGKLYICMDGDHQSICSIDPETYECTEVTAAADGVTIGRILGVLDDKLYISARDQEASLDDSFYLYHINSDGTIQQDVYLDAQGLERLFETIPAFYPHNMSIAGDGLYVSSLDGTLLHLSTSLELLDEYSFPDITFPIPTVYRTGDTLYGVTTDGYVRMKVGSDDYEPVSQRIREQGADIFSLELDADYLYFCNLSEDGAAMLYRADAETLQVQLMAELPLDVTLFADSVTDISTIKVYSYKLDDSHFMLWLTSGMLNQWQLVTVPTL